MEAQKDPSSSDVVNKFKEIADFLTDVGFIVKYRATDGDVSFDKVHYLFYINSKTKLDNEFWKLLII